MEKKHTPDETWRERFIRESKERVAAAKIKAARKKIQVYEDEHIALKAEVERLTATVNDLADALAPYLDGHNCLCGGFGEGGICPQPCDQCDKARVALKRAGR